MLSLRGESMDERYMELFLRTGDPVFYLMARGNTQG